MSDFCDICKETQHDAKLHTVCDTCSDKYGMTEEEFVKQELLYTMNLCPYAIIYEIGHYTSSRATVPHTISYVLNPLHACWALEMENARVRMIRVNRGSKEYNMASNNSNLQSNKDDELIYKKYLQI